MKKLSLLISAIVFSLFQFTTFAQDNSQQGIPSVSQFSFSDVPGDHTFYHYIESLKEKGIISGYADGTFHPEWFVKRQEMAKFVVKGFELSLNVEQKKDCEQFSDVAKDNVFYEDILTLKCLGIVNGKASPNPSQGGGSGSSLSYLGEGQGEVIFDPEAFVTRGEAMKFVINAARIKKGGDRFLKHSEDLQNPFADLNSGNVFYDYILDGYEYGIVEGKDGNFMTDHFFNRGGMGKVIYISNVQTLPNNNKLQFYKVINKLTPLGQLSNEDIKLTLYGHKNLTITSSKLDKKSENGLTINSSNAKLNITFVGDTKLIGVDESKAETLTPVKSAGLSKEFYRIKDAENKWSYIRFLSEEYDPNCDMHTSIEEVYCAEKILGGYLNNNEDYLLFSIECESADTDNCDELVNNIHFSTIKKEKIDISGYNLFKDNYISFYYPEGYHAEVESGLVVSTRCDDNVFTEGVEKIVITNNSSFTLSIWNWNPCIYDAAVLDHFNEENPEIISVSGFGEPSKEYVLVERPLVYYVTEIERKLLIFPYYDQNKNIKTPSTTFSSQEVLHVAKKYSILQPALIYKDLYTPFIGNINHNSLFYNSGYGSYLNLTCDLNMNIKGEECLQILTTFLKTAKRHK